MISLWVRCGMAYAAYAMTYEDIIYLHKPFPYGYPLEISTILYQGLCP